MIRTGAILNNRYEILEKIGSGGMAYVFKARDRKLNRLVAIKVLKEEYCKDKSFVAKFRMEAQAAAGLSHNNIVGVYDVSEENNVHFIVMELVDGITLKEYITRKKKLGAKETIGIAISIAQGMEAAHNRHIVHRDIKPQNIIISKDGRIKVTDFGIARAITDETTNLYGAAGSVHYISPEQARGGYCDERSDIYSLGVTMYEMVTGRVPFDGDTTVAVAIAHINEAMVPPSNIEASVPVALEQIIYKCTQKRPLQRYSSCSDLIKDLRHAIVAPNERFVHFIQPDELPSNETTVINEEQIRDIRNQTQKKSRDTRKTEVSGVRKKFAKETPAVSTRRNNQAAEKKKSESQYSREATRKPPVQKRSLEDPTLFDKIQVSIASILGIVMLFMLVYVVGSLGGAFQRRTPAAVNTTADTVHTTNTPASTYEKQSDESMEGERAEVPMLLGHTIEEGTRLLEENGLSIVVARNYEYSEDYAIGLICRQQYEAGTFLDKNSSVKVYISLGTDKFEINSKLYLNGNVSILNYYLKSFSEINVEYVRQYSDVYARDIVFMLEPSEGFIGSGDTLKVYVSLGPEYSEIPDLYGMEKEQAIARLQKSGFSVGNISQVYSNNTDPGLVCGQSIAPYSSKKSGTAVDFSISLGPKTVDVPFVVGVMEQDAFAVISAANLYYDPHYQESNEVPAGMIINQSPAGGGSVPEYSTVVLTISSGPPAIPLDPNVLTTMGQDQAIETLRALGLNSTVQYEPNNDIAAGCVIWWQSANGSDILHAGDTVILHVSTGPAQTDPPAPETVPSDTQPVVPPSDPVDVVPTSEAQPVSE